MNRQKYIFFVGILVAFVLTLTGIWSGKTARAADIPEKQVKKIKQALPDEPIAEPSEKRKVLIFTLCKGFTHGSIPAGTTALKMMGKKTGAYSADVSDDMSVFNEDKLAQYDAIILNNTTRLGFEKQKYRDALSDFVKEDGKGLIGFHAASDNFYKWEEGQKLIGGLFSGHPWGGGGTWAVKLEEPDHPLVKPFSGPFLVNDEIYLFKKGVYSRERSRVLLSLDMENPRNDVGNKGRKDNDHAISWIHSAGEGRVFYCGFGHHPHIFWTPAILRHSLAGIQYALGDLEADDTPSAKLSSATKPERTVSAANPFMGVVDWQFGDSRKKLAAIRKQVRTASEEEQQKLEKRLTATLEFIRSSYAAKQFACRMLRRIGTCYSVPALESLLDESDLSHMARYALQRMPCEKVDPVLRAALKRVNDDLKIGIISSLGARRDTEAIANLAHLLEDENSAVAHAAVDALARIGGPEAQKALNEADVAGSLQGDIQQARIICADSMLSQDQKEQARAIYRDLYENSNIKTVRGSALLGLVRSGASDGAEVLLENVQSGSPYMQRAAAKFLNRVQGEDISKALAEGMSALNPSGKIMVISALSSRGAKVAAPHVAELLDSKNNKVRQSAIEAMGNLGNASTVMPLARLAAGDDKAAETAFRSLMQITAEGVEEKIVSRLQDSDVDGNVRKVLIRLSAERGISKAVPALMHLAQENEAGLRPQAAKALARLVEARHAEELLNIVTQTGSRAAEKALVNASRKIKGKTRRAKPVVEALEQTDDTGAKGSLVRVLGQLGGKTALQAVIDVADSTNTDLRRTAVRTLADWPTAGPAERLLQIAREHSDNVTGILALRGYIKMVGSAEGLSAAQRLNRYKKAMKATARANEQKRVLSGASELAIPDALNFIGRYLDENGVRGEAQAAYLSIAKKLSLSHPDIARKAFNRLRDNSDNQAIVKQARRAAKNMYEHNGFIIAWRLSGPYTKDGMSGGELFDVAFAPEKNKKAEWRFVRGGQTDPWQVNLEKTIGGDNRVAYLRTGVRSPKEQSAKLQLGSDDGIKVWLNGKLIHENNATRPVSKADDTVTVDLKKGWNSLMLKIVEGTGQWGAAARFTNSEGQALDNLRINPSK